MPHAGRGVGPVEMAAPRRASGGADDGGRPEAGPRARAPSGSRRGLDGLRERFSRCPSRPAVPRADLARRMLSGGTWTWTSTGGAPHPASRARSVRPQTGTRFLRDRLISICKVFAFIDLIYCAMFALALKRLEKNPDAASPARATCATPWTPAATPTPGATPTPTPGGPCTARPSSRGASTRPPVVPPPSRST